MSRPELILTDEQLRFLLSETEREGSCALELEISTPELKLVGTLTPSLGKSTVLKNFLALTLTLTLPKSSAGCAAQAIDDEIDDLYEQIRTLAGQDSSPKDETEIDRLFSRLLELEKTEAEIFRRQFEASLEMPLDTGDDILTRARALREELEDLATGNPAATGSDETPT